MGTIGLLCCECVALAVGWLQQADSPIQSTRDAMKAIEDGHAAAARDYFEKEFNRRDNPWDRADFAFRSAVAAEKLGDRSAVAEWIGRACEQRYVDLDELCGDPEFASLRSDPDFPTYHAQVLRAFDAARRVDVDQARTTQRELAAKLGSAWIRGDDGHVQSMAGDDVVRPIFSPDGSRLLTIKDGGTARLWDVATGDALAIFDESTELSDVRFSADGEKILTLSTHDAVAKLWDGRSGEPVARLGGEEAITEVVRLAPSGDFVVTGDLDGFVRSWNLANGALIREFGQHAGSVSCLDFSADGRLLASGGDDGRIFLWDLSRGGSARQIDAHRGPVDVVQFDHRAQRLVSSGADRRACIWDCADSSKHIELASHPGSVWEIEFSSDDRRLLTTSRCLYSVSSPFNVDPTQGRRYSWFHRGRGFGSHDARSRLWDVAERSNASLLQDWPMIWRVRFNAAGDRILACPDRGMAAFYDGDPHGQQLMLDGATGALIAEIGSTKDRAPMLVEFVPGRDAIVTGSPEQGLRWWSDRTGKPMEGATIPGVRPIAIGFSMDRSTAAIVTEKQPAQIVDLRRNEVVRELVVESRLDLVDGLEMTSDGALVASVKSVDGHAVLTTWSSETGQTLDRVVTDLPRVTDVECAPNGPLVLLAWFGRGCVCDAVAGEVLACAQEESSPQLQGVGFCPTGDCIVAFRRDDLTLVRMDPASLKIEEVLPLPTLLTTNWMKRSNNPLRAIRQLINVIPAYTHVGERAALLNDNDDNHVLDIVDLRLSRTIARVPSVFNVAVRAFSDDGRRIVAIGNDRLAHLWSADDGHEIATLGSAPALEVCFVNGDIETMPNREETPPSWWNGTSGEPIAAPAARRLRAVNQYREGIELRLQPDDRVVATRFQYEDDEWLVHEPNLHYSASPRAADRVRLVLDGSSYPLSCYERVLRDPAKVAASIRGESVDKVVLVPPPTLLITSPAQPSSATVSDRRVHVEAIATDRHGIEKFVVVQDNVEVDGAAVARGFVRGATNAEGRFAFDFPMPPDQFETTITLRALNRRNVLSRKQTIHAKYEPPQRDLYVVAMGVGDYVDDAFDLKCPVRDVDDLVAALKQQQGALYREVKIERLADAEVTQAAALRLRDTFLEQAGPEDTIIVFAAGHGLRTDVGEYWFLTRTCTAANPYEGIPRVILESLVTLPKLHARRRVLLIDTCFAGTDIDANGTRGERGAGGVASLKPVDQKHLDQILDESRGGIYILAASADDEFAREQDGNGLFTRALIDGLAGAPDEPGWRDGLGLVEIEAPAGATAVELEHRAGAAEWTGGLVSLLSGAAILALGYMRARA